MKRTMLRLWVILSVWGWGMATSEATLLSHSVDGVLFNETFQNQVVAVTEPAGWPTTANITPGVAGSNDEWYPYDQTGGTGSVLNRNSASDVGLDGPRGQQYVRLDRPSNQAAMLIGDFGATDYGSGVLTMSFMAYVESGAGLLFRFDNLDDGTILTDVANIAMQFMTNPGGDIYYRNSLGNNVDSGLNWTVNQWQHYLVRYDLDADNFALTIDGTNTVSGLYANPAISDVSRFSWQSRGNDVGSFYIAANIPEPSSVLLLLVGSGLLWRWSRRKE